MAGYPIHRACGHTETVQIDGTDVNGERDRKVEWLATRPCGDCARTQKEAEWDVTNADAAASAAVRGWPALSGSDKQIAWAISIREERLGHKLPELLRRRISQALGPELRDELFNAMIAAGLAHTDASWWIDQRQTSIGGFVAALRAEIPASLRVRVDEAMR